MLPHCFVVLLNKKFVAIRAKRERERGGKRERERKREERREKESEREAYKT